MISDIIRRSAILLALNVSYPNGMDPSKLAAVIPDCNRHIEFLKKKGLRVESGVLIRLQDPVYYVLDQSVPPEIRRDVENLLWKLVSRPTIIDESAINQKVIRPNEEQLQKFRLIQQVSTVRIDSAGIRWLKKDAQEFPTACIHCADPPCMTRYSEAFGPTDTFPSRICPANVISQLPDGIVVIDQSGCTGCMLCILRCPISAIYFSKGVATKREYSDLPSRARYVEEVTVSLKEKRTITSSSLAGLAALLPVGILEGDIREILDNFDRKVSPSELNWAQDQYYVWVRNVLREMGLDALYTGSGGKLKRADVTVKKPFYAGIEIKSPAEGDISVGAIRQAIDAAREVAEAYHAKVAFCAAVGQEIGTRVHARAVSWRRFYKINVPLIRGRYLLFLLLKHKTTLPQDPLSDIKRLFTDFYGWFGKNEFSSYFEVYFNRRRAEITSGQITLSLPRAISKGIEKEGRKWALQELDHLETETRQELETCFPDPERTSRGGYALSEE